MSCLENEKQIVSDAIGGDNEALEILLGSVKDMVFNLSLRMLGVVPDAEDATQEILIRVMTKLSSFRRESSFSTWVFRIAVNHLKNYQKGMFAKRPLSFEVYGEDISSDRERDVPDLSGGVDRRLLEQELKLSCSNVMLQCLDEEERCIYVLGTMFRLDSRTAAEILELTPENYRQRLSRIRKRMKAFLSEYCDLGGSGTCACARRVDYAIATHRLNPGQMDFQSLESCGYEELDAFTQVMEELDTASQVFADFSAYRSSAALTERIKDFMRTDSFSKVLSGEAGK